MYDEYNTLVDRLQSLQQRPNPFDTLPTELVSQIFLEYSHTVPDGIYILSLVCKHWLEVVAETANLWTSVTINPSEPTWKERLGVYLTRSKDRLLDISLSTPFSAEEIDQVASHSFDRWRDLLVLEGRNGNERGQWPWVQVPDDAQNLINLLRKHPFPNLCTIDVQVKPKKNSRAPLLFSSIFSHNHSMTDLPTRHLLLSHLSINLYWTQLEDIEETLKGVPNLKTLKFSAQRDRALHNQQLSDTPSVPLHALEKLVMEDGVPAAYILHLIDCPQLHSLQAACGEVTLSSIRKKLQPLHHLKHLYLKVYGEEFNLESDKEPEYSLERLKIEDRLLHGGPSETRDGTEKGVTLYYPQYIVPFLKPSVGVKQVTITSDRHHSDRNSSTEWKTTLEHICGVEKLDVEETRVGTNLTWPNASTIPMEHLQSLAIIGPLASRLVPLIDAPELRMLRLADSQNLQIDQFANFMTRSPLIQSISLERLVSAPHRTPFDIPRRFFKEATLTHGTSDAITRFLLSNVDILHVKAVPQEKAANRGKFYYLPREIHLPAFLPGVFSGVQQLDLRASVNLFPSVIGFEGILHLLKDVKKISLPRALADSTIILVDALVQAMLASSDICPRLEEIYTEDYPQWEPLIQLVTRRNWEKLSALMDETNGLEEETYALVEETHVVDEETYALVEESHVVEEEETCMDTTSIRCIHVPGLPHPLILCPLQTVLAGKFASPPHQETLTTPAPDGCDDCALAGWTCLEPTLDKEGMARSRCARHKGGMVRLTGYS